MNLIDILDIYSLQQDSDEMFLMFSNITIDSRINKDILNTTIISELGAMRPITTDPDLYKILVDNFFKKYSSNITRLLDTTTLDYDPIGNKNITEEEHRHSVGDIDNTDTYDRNTDETSQNDVSAYDSTSFQPKSKDTIDNDVHHSGVTTSDIDSTVDTNKTIKGKDGDTPFQDLIEKERKLVEFNIYNWIVSQMRRELFLLVY